MSSHHERQYKLSEHFCQYVSDIYRTAKMLNQSNKQLSEKLTKIYSMPGYSVLTNFSIGQIHGSKKVHNDYLYRNDLVFAYYIDGEFLPIDSKKYKAIPAYTVSHLHGNLGAHVWRNDTSKVFHGYNPDN